MQDRHGGFSASRLSRRYALKVVGALAGGSALTSIGGCERQPEPSRPGAGPKRRAEVANDEYVWLSASVNLPMFVARDHRALRVAAEELGVKVTLAGPNTVDIPGLVAAVEQTAARRPTGMMVVGWEPSALIAAIDRAVESGVPVICVDADVPGSKRLTFVGTNWYELGARQGEEMVKALGGRRGKVGLQGLIEISNQQEAFQGFRSVVEKVGLTPLEPQQDRGNIGEATRVAAATMQAHPDLVGMAGFDSESGPGIGQALREAGMTGRIVATCVDGEPHILHLVKAGILAAAVCQKRELFTYYGLRALYDLAHTQIQFTPNDKNLGLYPIPARIDTGTYTVTRHNIGAALAT